MSELRSSRRFAWLRRHAEQCVLVAVFVVSRVVLWRLGVQFDASSIPFFMQYLDPRLLQSDLVRSLFELHSQPPLMNLCLGLALKLGRVLAIPALEAAFLALSLHGVLAVYGLGRAVRIGRKTSLAIALVFALSPTLILYENWLFYALPTSVWATIAAARLARLIRRPRPKDAVVLVLASTALAWTWGVFHLVWLMLVVGWAAYRLRLRSRSFIAVSGLALALTVALYAKNALVFGHFAPSSWSGMNLYRVASATIPRNEAMRVQKAAGVPSTATRAPFSPIAAYRDKSLYARCPRGAHPSVCAVKKRGGHINYNHLGYARLSNDYAAAAKALMVAHPGAYVDALGVAAARFWNPPTDHSFVGGTRKRIRGYADAFTKFPYLAFGKPTGNPSVPPNELRRRISWGPLVLFSLATLLSLVRLVSRLRGRARCFDPVLGPLFVFFWFFVVSCLFEVGENERFRFTVEPLVFVVSGWILWSIHRGLSSRWRARSAAASRA